MRKRIFIVADQLCSGCRNCQMWCSFLRKQGNVFNPTFSCIRIMKDAEGILNIPTVDCDGEGCPHNENEEYAKVALKIADYVHVLSVGRITLHDTAVNLQQNKDIQKIYPGGE